MEIAQSIGINVLAAIVYDVGKFLFRTKFYKKEELLNINNKFDKKFKKKYEMLYKNDDFNYFLSIPSNKDIIEKYIVSLTTSNIILLEKDKFPITINSKNEVIDYLYLSLEKEFSKNKKNIPNKEIFSSFFEDYFNYVEEYFLNQLSNEGKIQLYLTRNMIYQSEGEMIFHIQELKKSIDKLIVLQIENNVQNNYKNIVDEYHRILRKNKEKSHVYLLDTLDFSKFYVPPYLRILYDKIQLLDNQMLSPKYRRQYTRHRRNYDSFDDWKHIFDYSSFVYVIGGPGYGKSLFLTKLINDCKNANFLNSEDYLIIRGDLKSYRFKDDNPESVLDFLQNSMINETLMDEKDLSKEMIKYYLDSGRCLILLDALDEVEKNKRDKLHRKIVNYFETKNPNNKICITSRSRGFIQQNDHIVYEILPLNRDQIECYVNNIIELGKFEKNDKNIFLNQANELIMKNFLNSFLILSLLVNIFKAERELPETKLDLYQKCFEIITYKREKEKSKHKYDWNLISYLMKDNTFIELAQMGYPNNKDIEKNDIINSFCNIYSRKYSSEVETERAIEQFLDFCSERTELFVPASGEDKFRFFHRSFFEYFYSQYIFLRLNKIEEMYSAMKQFDIDSEVFELILSTLKQKDEYKYQELIDYLFVQAKNEIQNDNIDGISAFDILTLGMEVIDDIEFKNEYVNYIVENKEFFKNNKKERFLDDKILKVILQDDEYINNVNEVYKKDAKFESFLSFLKCFDEIIIHRDAKESIRYNELDRQYTLRVLYRESFYVRTYLSVEKKFNNIPIDREKFESSIMVYKELKINKYRYMRSFNLYDKLSSEQKEMICDRLSKLIYRYVEHEKQFLYIQ